MWTWILFVFFSFYALVSYLVSQTPVSAPASVIHSGVLLSVQ